MPRDISGTTTYVSALLGFPGYWRIAIYCNTPYIAYSSIWQPSEEMFVGRVLTTEMAGSIIRRVREERSMSRAELARKAGIGARTLYALEVGESENFGLGNYLKLLEILGLSLSVDVDGHTEGIAASTTNTPELPVLELADIWKNPLGGKSHGSK